MISIEEMRKLQSPDLVKQIEKTREEIFRLRLKQTYSQVKDTSQSRKLRRVLARLLTVQKEGS